MCSARTVQGLVLGGLLLSLAGCSTTESERAQDALQRWEDKGPRSYVYVVNAYGIRKDSLFIDTGADFPGDWRIVVEDGEVIKAQWVNRGTLVADPVEDMTALLKRVIFYMTDGGYTPEDYEATFDERWGYVRKFHAGVDVSTDIGVECLEEGAGLEHCPLLTVPLDQCLSEPIPPPQVDHVEYDFNACPSGQWMSPVADADLVCCRGN